MEVLISQANRERYGDGLNMFLIIRHIALQCMFFKKFELVVCC